MRSNTKTMKLMSYIYIYQSDWQDIANTSYHSQFVTEAFKTRLCSPNTMTQAIGSTSDSSSPSNIVSGFLLLSQGNTIQRFLNAINTRTPEHVISITTTTPTAIPRPEKKH